MHAVSAEFQRQLPVVIDKQLQLMFLTKCDGSAQALSELFLATGFQPQLHSAQTRSGDIKQLTKAADHRVNAGRLLQRCKACCRRDRYAGQRPTQRDLVLWLQGQRPAGSAKQIRLRRRALQALQ